MNRLLAFVAAGALMCAGMAYGQTPAPAAAPKAATPAPAPAAAPATPAPKAADAKTADAAKSTNSQQDKMKACNDKAGDKKGDDRKAFMKTCLSAKPPAPMTQGEKMSMCNKKTAGMAKEERSKAQSECMKGA
jgi:hypothetical protein